MPHASHFPRLSRPWDPTSSVITLHTSPFSHFSLPNSHPAVRTPPFSLLTYHNSPLATYHLPLHTSHFSQFPLFILGPPHTSHASHIPLLSLLSHFVFRDFVKLNPPTSHFPIFTSRFAPPAHHFTVPTFSYISLLSLLMSPTSYASSCQCAIIFRTFRVVA